MVMTFYVLPQPMYIPAMKAISNITNGFPAVVTTTTDHNYINGIIVRIVIQPGYGMQQLNMLMGAITIIDATNFNLFIDTTAFDPYVTPSTTPQTCQVVPVGDNSQIGDGYIHNRLPY